MKWLIGAIVIIIGVVVIFGRQEKKWKSGYVVYKEYEAGHMCCSTPVKTFEAGVVVVPHVTTRHIHRYEQSTFTLFIGSRNGVRQLGVDSIRYTKYHCGQKIFYKQ